MESLEVAEGKKEGKGENQIQKEKRRGKKDKRDTKLHVIPKVNKLILHSV